MACSVSCLCNYLWIFRELRTHLLKHAIKKSPTEIFKYDMHIPWWFRLQRLRCGLYKRTFMYSFLWMTHKFRLQAFRPVLLPWSYTRYTHDVGFSVLTFPPSVIFYYKNTQFIVMHQHWLHCVSHQRQLSLHQGTYGRQCHCLQMSSTFNYKMCCLYFGGWAGTRLFQRS